MTTPPEVKIVRIAGHYEVLLTENSTICGEGDSPELAFKNLMLKVLDYRIKNNSDPLENTQPLSSSYSGRFSVRLDHKLHHLLNLEAQKKGLSLNSLIIQKLSKDLEPLTKERRWSLHNNEVNPFIALPQFHFHLFFLPIDSSPHEQKVIILNNTNIAVTLGDQYGNPPTDGNLSKNKTAFSKYIKDTPSIMAAFERFLNDPEVRMTGKDTYRCYLLRIKGDDEKETVYNFLKRHLAAIGHPGEISATKLLERFDEFIVFEV